MTAPFPRLCDDTEEDAGFFDVDRPTHDPAAYARLVQSWDRAPLDTLQAKLARRQRIERVRSLAAGALVIAAYFVMAAAFVGVSVGIGQAIHEYRNPAECPSTAC